MTQPAIGFNLFSPGNTSTNRVLGALGPKDPAPFQPLPANGLNFVGMQNAVAIHSQTQNNAQLVALAAVTIFSRASGMFDYDIDASFADNITAKTVRLRAVLYPGSAGSDGVDGGGGFSQSSGTPSVTAPVYGPSYGSTDPIVTNPLIVAQLSQDSTGLSANGLLYGVRYGAAVPMIDTVTDAIILWDQEVDTLTGELSNGDGAFHAHGRAGFAAGVPATGFGPGNWAVLVLELVSILDDSGDVITFGPCSMGLAEVG